MWYKHLWKSLVVENRIHEERLNFNKVWCKFTLTVYKQDQYILALFKCKTNGGYNIRMYWYFVTGLCNILCNTSSWLDNIKINFMFNKKNAFLNVERKTEKWISVHCDVQHHVTKFYTWFWYTIKSLTSATIIWEHRLKT